MAFDSRYGDLDVRSDLLEAYRRAWGRLARPGTWWTGAERVALAAACRAARDCALCAERKAALSPFAVEGEHAGEAQTALLPEVVDFVHRVTTDATRLSKGYVEKLLAGGLSPERYVEALGVVVQVLSIDRADEALGLPLEPLPAPAAGEPSRQGPKSVVPGAGFVPWLDTADLGDDADLFHGLPQVPNVLRALSLVPAELRGAMELSEAQYLPPHEMMSFERDGALTRAQIELVAGRLSALNECFY